MESVTAYLGLGSNLGQREAHLAQAVQLLAGSPQVQVLRSSSTYQTSPWGVTDQPDFLNSVLEVTTTLQPVALLELVKAIEEQVGRKETFRWGPRVIDVDILLYGDRIIQVAEPDLRIPHLHLAERAFVLVPLVELAGDLLHPVLKVSLSRLVNGVAGKDEVQLWGPPLELPAG